MTVPVLWVIQCTQWHGSVCCCAPAALFSNPVCMDTCTWIQPGTTESLQVPSTPSPTDFYEQLCNNLVFFFGRDNWWDTSWVVQILRSRRKRLHCVTIWTFFGKMTQRNESSVLSSSYSSVRVSVYRALELWLQVAGASANILQGSPAHSELLFSHLLGDITPGAEAVKVSTDFMLVIWIYEVLCSLQKDIHLCPFLQLRVGLSADVVPGGKPGPRRTKPLVIADTVGQALQRKGDIMANQDTCLSALRGEAQFVCLLERWCFSESVNVIDLFSSAQHWGRSYWPVVRY